MSTTSFGCDTKLDMLVKSSWTCHLLPRGLKGSDRLSATWHQCTSHQNQGSLIAHSRHHAMDLRDLFTVAQFIKARCKHGMKASTTKDKNYVFFEVEIVDPKSKVQLCYLDKVRKSARSCFALGHKCLKSLKIICILYILHIILHWEDGGFWKCIVILIWEQFLTSVSGRTQCHHCRD